MKFSYFGRELEGFNHLYNSTYLNERAVELAVAFDWLYGRDTDNGLEFGNVLGHYGFGGHHVVDRYEPATELQRLKRWPVHQIDVFDTAVKVGSSWDWIVAISTIEHVRYDMDADDDVDPEGSLNALLYLQSLLAPAGQMLVTVPCGFHPVLDNLIVEELTGATRSCTLVRDWGADHDQEGCWVQTDEPTIIDYGSSGPWADSVWIGEFERSTTSWPPPS